MKPGVAARLHAARLVVRVLDDGAHSNVLLAHDLGAAEEWRPVVQRLLLDTLRWMPKIEPALEAVSSRSLADVDPVVRSVLRVAATELDTGGEAHGVIDSSVEVVKEEGSPRAAGFVNAILRKIARSGLPRPADPQARASAAVGCPKWLRDRLVAVWGAPEADAFLEATLQPPRIGLRWRPGAEPRGEPTGIDRASYVATRGEVPDDGETAVVMDPASTAVAVAAHACRGMSVLDVAAAPGNKTGALWDAMGGVGLLVAADRHERRVSAARRRLRQVGADWVVADGSRPPFRPATFDRVLIDAPCSGLGTLRRRPEIKLRLDPSAPARLGLIQRSLIEASLPLVAPGGRLIYAVCTVLPEETVDVVDRFGGGAPPDLPGRVWGGGLLLGPHITGTDGMFVSLIHP